MARILVVEDDIDTRNLVARALGPDVELRAAEDLATASHELERFEPDLVLLDVSLPDGEGYQLCSTLQNDAQTRDVPIVFLTARDEPRDRITAFHLGADDYLSKPFEPRELRARVESRLRKAERRRSEDQTLRRANLCIDVARYRVVAGEEGGEREIELTPHEFRILHHLAGREDRVVSRNELMRAVWGETVVLARTVDSHISHLRRKLGSAGACIQSVRGVGYRFVAAPQQSP